MSFTADLHLNNGDGLRVKSVAFTSTDSPIHEPYAVVSIGTPPTAPVYKAVNLYLSHDQLRELHAKIGEAVAALPTPEPEATPTPTPARVVCVGCAKPLTPSYKGIDASVVDHWYCTNPECPSVGRLVGEGGLPLPLDGHQAGLTTHRGKTFAHCSCGWRGAGYSSYSNPRLAALDVQEHFAART